MATTEKLPTNSMSIPTVNTKAVLAKALILFVLAIGGAVLCATPLVRPFFDKAGPLADWFRSLGSLGMLIFVLSSALLILVGVPRLLLCPVAGVLYGFFVGLGVSLVATMISYYIGFIWIRGRRRNGLSPDSLPKQLAFLAGNPGISGVMIGRVIPAPGMVVTMTLALSNVSTGAYLIGSAIGLIPEAVPMVLAGTMQGNFQKWAKMSGMALLAIGLAWVVIHYLSRRYIRAKSVESVNG